MPVRLSELVAQKRWIDVDVAGANVRVAYSPNKITLRRADELSRLQEIVEADGDLEYGVEMAKMFCDLIVEWDIVDDEGKPYPITVEALLDFPSGILTAITQAVQEDVEAENESKKTRSATSDDTSSQTGSLAPVRNGTR